MVMLAVKRTHKLHSKPVTACRYALQQLLSHFTGGNRRIVDEFYQFVYFPVQLSARLKLHNIPALFVDISLMLELPGVSFSHQDMPSRSLMCLRHSVVEHTLFVYQIVP